MSSSGFLKADHRDNDFAGFHQAVPRFLLTLGSHRLHVTVDRVTRQVNPLGCLQVLQLILLIVLAILLMWAGLE